MSMSLRFLRNSTKRVTGIRWYSAKVQVKESQVPDVNEASQQAPNRVTPWTRSQQPRAELVDDLRFVQKDLAAQPRPYSAMELIAKQPVRYIEHGNIAVCNGNKGPHQGHPKIFINLDPARPHVCGYCGLRFAQAKYKDLIEAGEPQK